MKEFVSKTLFVTGKNLRPKFTDQLKDTEVVEGSSVELECRIAGSPKPTIEWSKNGRDLREGQRIQSTFDGEVCKLKITEATLSDKGEYQCVARNKVGTTFCTAKLHVVEATSKPEFKDAMQDVEVTVGDEAVFEVSATAKPSPKVEWYKGKEKIKEGGRIVFEEDEDKGVFTLVIKHCKLSDNGGYTCTLSNEAGTDSSSAELAIKEELNAPRFVNGAGDELVEVWEGAPIRLVVAAKGKPAPTIEWFKENRPAKRIKRAELQTEGAKNILSVSKSVPDDSGAYRCQASNPAGTVSKVFNVTVHGWSGSFVLLSSS